MNTAVSKIIHRIMTRNIYKLKKGEGIYSQYGQDKFVSHTLLNGMQHGTFIEIGANDGITYSNTCYMERKLNWNGIAIEPLPKSYEQLKKNRTCTTIQGCVSNQKGQVEFLAIEGYAEMLSGIIDKYDKKHTKRIKKELNKYGGEKEVISVDCYTMNEIAEEHGISRVDYMSIDTEGGEFEILKSIDFKKLNVQILSVENNYRSLSLIKFMKELDYELVAIAGKDEIYQKKNR